jgi:hypothetical protein
MLVGTTLASIRPCNLAAPRADFLVFCAEPTAEEGLDVQVCRQYFWFKEILIHNLYKHTGLIRRVSDDYTIRNKVIIFCCSCRALL